MKEIKTLKNIKNKEPIISDDNIHESAVVNEVITVNNDDDLTIMTINEIG